MALNFDKYAHEGHSFMNELARNLGHPEEISRAGIILRAVLHTLREKISIGESLNLVAQLPMFLKGIYVDKWEYIEKPAGLKTREEFISEVERRSELTDEQRSSWNISTEDIIGIVFNTLTRYISDGEAEDIMTQLPKEIKELFRQNVPQR